MFQLIKNLLSVRPEEATAAQTEKRIAGQYPKEVYEIHQSFNIAGEKLLKEAYEIIRSKEKELQDIEQKKKSIADEKKAQDLEAFGFKNVPQVVTVNAEKRNLSISERDAAIMKKERERLANAIQYFKRKYPMYKFITIAEVENICKRYNLVYGDVALFKGFVPEKNLQEIKRFKISDADKALAPSQFSLLMANSWHNKVSLQGRWGIFVPFFIAAPKKDMDMTNVRQEGYLLVNSKNTKDIPDPVVLQPVVYVESSAFFEERLSGFLIVTAWGDEASDELVVNENHN